MKETPIIMSTELIPKILDGIKTQREWQAGMKKDKSETVCEILAMHYIGLDIESIARRLRNYKNDIKVDIHFVGIVVGCFVSNVATLKKENLDTIYPETACKTNGIISAGQNFVMCPIYRKPSEKE